MKISELLEEYNKGRDKISALKKEFEAEELKIKEYMGKIAAKLHAYAKEQGLENLSSSDYTMYWTKNSSPRIANAEEFFEYIIANQRFDLLERRVAKLTTMAIINEGEVIPGIEVYSEIKPNLRRIKKDN